MNDAIPLAATVFGSCLLASLAHEATHYGVARFLGREATFDVREFAVFYESAQTIGLVEVAIAGAPVVLGLAVGAVAVLSGELALEFMPAWYLYALHGAITNDFQFQSVNTDDAMSM